MNFSYLLSEILRGYWSIEPQTALAHGSLVASLINGSGEDFTPREAWQYSFSSGGSIVAGDNYNDVPAGSVAIIPLKGTMMKYGTMCSYGTTEIADRFSQAMNSKKISAIVLDIDSGGGAVNAIPPLMNVLGGRRKAVVGLCDTAASAAYFAAANCDHIMADNSLSAGFGSIGVVTSFADMQPYWELKGVKFHTVYAPESKDKNLAFEKALKGDYALMQSEILSPLAQQFQNHVKQSRSGKLDEKVPGILSGKMFFAQAALEHGLIDSIGNMQKAISKALELAEIKKFMNSQTTH
jgi:protease-4